VVNEATGKKIPTACMAWACPCCARLLSYRVRKRIAPIEWLAKVEFTLDGDGAPTRENNLRLARGQRSVLQWVRRLYRRKYGKDFTFRYARMHGISDVGRLHSHMLWDIPFVEQEELSDHAAACRLGIIVYIKPIDKHHDGDKRAIDYVANQAIKYVANQALEQSKDGADLPRGCRRFQSAGVAPYQPEPGWFYHRHCPYGLPCEICGLCPEPEVFREEFGRWLKYWDLNTATGELRPRELTLRALTSLVTDGETASVPAAETANLPHQARLWGEERSEDSS